MREMKYNWNELSRSEKTDIMTCAVMRNILIRGNNQLVGLREINVNIGKGKSNLRIDVLQINKRKNELDGFEIKSCIQDFRSDKKWHKYLDLVNRLYFVFDTDTFNKHKKEIIKKIDGKAGIYTYNPKLKWVNLQEGAKYTELPPKDEVFYRTILFNYLFRNQLRAF